MAPPHIKDVRVGLHRQVVCRLPAALTCTGNTGLFVSLLPSALKAPSGAVAVTVTGLEAPPNSAGRPLALSQPGCEHAAALYRMRRKACPIA